MFLAISSIIVWAFLEELIKATGVRIALRTRFLIPALLWFFVIESLLKAEYLADFYDDDAGRYSLIYVFNLFLGASSSIIHLYSSIYYMKCRNIIYAVLTCTALHAVFNVVGVSMWPKSLDGGPGYTEVLLTASAASSCFGLLLVPLWGFDRYLSSRFRQSYDV